MQSIREISDLHKFVPSEMADICRRISDHVQVHESMVLTQLLAALSSVTMLRYKVDCGSGVISQLGLAVKVIAESSAGKSTVDSIVCGPMRSWAAAKNLVSSEEKLDQLMEHDIWKAKVKKAQKDLNLAVKDGEDPDSASTELAMLKLTEPKVRQPWRLEVRTGTIPGLLEMFKQSGGAAFWNCPDGGAALTSSLGGGFSVLADLWSGVSPVHVTRTHGVDDFSDIAFAASIAVQPEIFEKFVVSKRGMEWNSSGLMGRFLSVMPHSVHGYRAIPLYDPGRLSLPFYDKKVSQLLEEAFSGGPKIILKLSPDAYATLQQFRRDIEPLLQDGKALRDKRSIAGKIAENAARIAAIYHVISSSTPGTIDVWTMEKAVNTARAYLLEHVLLFDQKLNSLRVERAIHSMLRHLERRQACGIMAEPVSSLSKSGNADLRDPNVRAEAVLQAMNRQLIYISIPFPGKIQYVGLTMMGAQMPRNLSSTQFI